MFAIGDGTEVLAVESAFENALDYALNRTGGTVQYLGREWEGRGDETNDTLFVYEFDADETDADGNYVFVSERAAMV